LRYAGFRNRCIRPLCHLSQEKIRAYCTDTFLGRKVTYVEQGPEKGTGAALRYAEPFIKDRFMVTFADDLLAKKDLEALTTYDYALLVSENEMPERFGVISLNPDGTLFTITEKPERPQTNLINTGVAMLDKKIFNYEPSLHNSELYATDMITGLAQEYPVYIVKTSFWQPVGYPEHIVQAETVLREFTKS
jgi:dTDP-glucose pyrophosphorylase